MHSLPQQPVTEAELRALVDSISTEPVTALSSLAGHAKKLAARDQIERLVQDRSVLYGALVAPEPKARKNAARLLGALGQARDTDALVAALQTETTRFVVPSILLALGAIANKPAGDAIRAYVPPTAADETEEKHVADILEAHNKALAALTRDVPLPPRTKLAAPMELLLVPPVGFGEILLKETASRGFSATLHEDGVRDGPSREELQRDRDVTEGQVQVDQADARAGPGGERHREVGGDRGLADPALR